MAINIEELQAKITALSPAEFAGFREWFEAHLAQVWNQRFEADVRNGKLDDTARQALEDFRQGKCSE